MGCQPAQQCQAWHTASRLRAGRRRRGDAEAGYTLQEAAALARSSVPAQRTAACRLLGAVLARARPTPADALRCALSLPGCQRVLEAPPGADPEQARSLATSRPGHHMCISF